MSEMPSQADVLHAFIEPLLDVIRSATGLTGQLGPMTLARSMPAPPYMKVQIQVRGRVFGPIICTFDPAMAREVTARMMATEESPAFDSPECRDALGELANILVGNATGALLDVGCAIELAPPHAEVAHEAGELAHRTLSVPVTTEYGQMNLLIGLSAH